MTGQCIGYIRVSTEEQNPERQLEGIELDRVFTDKVSGKDVNRPALQEMLSERGIDVDHTTIYRWVQKYAPEIEKKLRYIWKPCFSRPWHVDETYIKIKGKWTYLYRAIDQNGKTIDFYLSYKRNSKAAKRFLGKALRSVREWEKARTINTDKASS